MKDVKIIPYRTWLNRKWDRIYEFLYLAKNPKQEYHITKITVDEVNHEYDLVINMECSCPDTKINKNHLCKHKKDALRILDEVYKRNEIELKHKES